MIAETFAACACLAPVANLPVDEFVRMSIHTRLRAAVRVMHVVGAQINLLYKPMFRSWYLVQAWSSVLLPGMMGCETDSCMSDCRDLCDLCVLGPILTIDQHCHSSSRSSLFSKGIRAEDSSRQYERGLLRA